LETIVVVVDRLASRGDRILDHHVLEVASRLDAQSDEESLARRRLVERGLRTRGAALRLDDAMAGDGRLRLEEPARLVAGDLDGRCPLGQDVARILPRTGARRNELAHRARKLLDDRLVAARDPDEAPFALERLGGLVVRVTDRPRGGAASIAP